MNYRLLFLAFASIIFVAALNFVASAFYYYWTIPWFDNVVHFFGGLSIGLLSLWIYFQSGLFKNVISEKKNVLIISVIWVMVVGIGWEIFEYMNGLTQSTESYPLDVFHDLLSDFVGAIVAGVFVAQKKLYDK